MNEFLLWDINEVAETLAKRTKELRLSRNWKQNTLASRAGVTLASLRRFEQTGRISLRSLLKIALTLGRIEEFTKLLTPPKARTLDELRKLTKNSVRKRGSK